MAKKPPKGTQGGRKRSPGATRKRAKSPPAKRRVPSARTKSEAGRRTTPKVAAAEPSARKTKAAVRRRGLPPTPLRQRRLALEVEEGVPTPPSSLDLDRSPSAARSGRHELREARLEHPEVSPEITAGDVDANWEDAYAIGDEAPGGDNPTPDQDRVDDIGRALGVEYQDNEELRASDKIAARDRKRWELHPASSEDYRDRE